MITAAKGLTSGYAPLGAVLVGPRVAEPFWRPGTTEIFRHGYTYQSHPTSCAVGLANLDLLEREQLIGRVAATGVGAAAQVRAAGRPQLVSEVRSGTGLLTAVELAPEARRLTLGWAPAWSRALRQRGVITRLLRGVALQVSPPFVITEAELGQSPGLSRPPLTPWPPRPPQLRDLPAEPGSRVLKGRLPNQRSPPGGYPLPPALGGQRPAARPGSNSVPGRARGCRSLAGGTAAIARWCSDRAGRRE